MSDTVRRGNPISSMRFRYQTWNGETDDPYESDWTQTKADAIRCGANCLIREYERFGTTNMIVKVFNEMNYKQAPTIITLVDAYRITGKARI